MPRLPNNTVRESCDRIIQRGGDEVGGRGVASDMYSEDGWQEKGKRTHSLEFRNPPGRETVRIKGTRTAGWDLRQL